MAPILLASVLLLSFSCLTHATTGRPEYIHCQNNLECGAGYCCTIGPIRYSTPQCKPMQAAGETCRPSSASTINMTASYPDGAQVLLTDVHYILCPCADGLFCDRGTCIIGERETLCRVIDCHGEPKTGNFIKNESYKVI